MVGMDRCCAFRPLLAPPHLWFGWRRALIQFKGNHQHIANTRQFVSMGKKRSRPCMSTLWQARNPSPHPELVQRSATPRALNLATRVCASSATAPSDILLDACRTRTIPGRCPFHPASQEGAPRLNGETLDLLSLTMLCVVPATGSFYLILALAVLSFRSTSRLPDRDRTLLSFPSHFGLLILSNWESRWKTEVPQVAQEKLIATQPC